jgi:ParB family chromosome partitioning protein
MNPFKSKKGLGRGLSSLIGDIKSTSTNNKLLISDVVRSKLQPRKNFDKQYLEDLTNSIKERGVVQPIIVRKSKDISGKYEIIAGERRWLASQNAGLNEIPSIIIEADDLKSLEFAIVENVQRHDLNPIEEANGYKKLMDDFGYDQDKVAKFIGKSRAHIANCLRLLSLPDNVIQLVETNKLSQGHAKILVGLENCFVIAKKIIDKKLSVRQSENLVRLFKNKSNRKISLKSANIKDLENILKDKLGIRVLINNKKNNRGSISFEYKDLDQLNRIIEIIKSNY